MYIYRQHYFCVTCILVVQNLLLNERLGDLLYWIAWGIVIHPDTNLRQDVGH